MSDGRMVWDAVLTHDRFGWSIRYEQRWVGPDVTADGHLRPIGLAIEHGAWAPTRRMAERKAGRKLQRLNHPSTVSAVVRGA